MSTLAYTKSSSLQAPFRRSTSGSATAIGGCATSRSDTSVGKPDERTRARIDQGASI